MLTDRKLVEIKTKYRTVKRVVFSQFHFHELSIARTRSMSKRKSSIPSSDLFHDDGDRDKKKVELLVEISCRPK